MFEIDENNLPFVRTRQALLALDLQNDFLSTGAPLLVETPPDFVDRIVNLASHFRTSGNVIWIRTVFEKSRPVNDAHGDSESVITDMELPADDHNDEEDKPRSRPSQKLLERYIKIAEDNGRKSSDAKAGLTAAGKVNSIRETYLTVEYGERPSVVSGTSPGANLVEPVGRCLERKKDLIFQKTYYSAFKDGSLVQILRANFVTEIYLCGSLTNISVFATAMDAARHGYAITIIDDCLGYRSKDRHDEALRKLVEFTGCDIINSADLVRDIQQREKREQKARTPKAPRPPPRTNPHPREQDSDIDKLMANLDLRSGGSTAPRSNGASTGTPKKVAVPESGGSSDSLGSSELAEELKLPAKPTEVDGQKRERVKTKVKTRRRHSRSGPRDSEETGGPSTVGKVLNLQASPTLHSASQALENIPKASETEATVTMSSEPSSSLAGLEVPVVKMKNGKQKEKQKEKAVSLGLDSEIEKMAKLSVAEEPTGLCEGDTAIIKGLLDDELAEGIFDRIRDEVRWQKMSHQGGDVPRLVAVQGDIAGDGSIPIYRHPADESPPLSRFSPTVSLIRKRVEEKLGHPVNHALIQFYRDGNDYISEHSDKTLDIVPKTFIANVSLGAQRTMVFRTKKQQKTGDESPSSETVQPRQVCRAPLPHNSMCKVGLLTNMRWLHGIRQDKRMASEKSPEELAYNGGRISLTFRLIGTFLDKDQQKIWGQGAVSKSMEDARTVVNGDAAESEKMIRAFGKENHSSEFDWNEHYGEGFDVLHISNAPKLFLSGDFVADMRVKLLLSVYGIVWSEGSLSPSFNWKNGSSSTSAPPIPEILPVKFVDNDLSKSTVVGDLAIMLYLDVVYGIKTDKSTRSHVELARQFTRFQQCADLLKKWREVPFSVKPFRREMELWEAIAAEAPFIAGSTISLADYALWPVLDEIHGEWGDFDDLDSLGAYYKRLKELASFVNVLNLPKEKGDPKTA